MKRAEFRLYTVYYSAVVVMWILTGCVPDTQQSRVSKVS